MSGQPAHPPRFDTVTRGDLDAPWLTLVHALSQDRRVFSAQVTEFAPDYRLLLVDLPGHGLASAHPGPYSLETYAASVRAAMDAAQVRRTHFCGTHTGAMVGLLLACREPSLFHSLVLEGPMLPGHSLPSVTQGLERVRATAREQGINAARQRWWDESGWFAAMRARPGFHRAAEQRAIIADFQGRPWLEPERPGPVATVDHLLKELRTPTLIINGEEDVPDFLQATETLMTLLPNARCVRIPRAGGFPLWESPGRVNPLVRAFLDAL